MSKIKINIPQNISSILSKLENKGFKAYIVGGCVRDSILKKAPLDWNICTNAKPEQICEIFSDLTVIKTGLKHGTVSVISDSEIVEVTTFRYDYEYSDHRRPNDVKFVNSIEEDLARRDFTINALAYNETDGLIDIFNGVLDIENKIIRCVREPKERFCEDTLRIMRALRFSSDLGFEIEEKTKYAIIEQYNLLEFISSERIKDELLKLICGDNVYNVLLEYKEIIFYIIPELKLSDHTEQKTPHHIYNVYEHIIHSVENIENNKLLRMTMLLHDIGKPQALRIDENGVYHFKQHQQISHDKSISILKRLKFSNAQIKYILNLILEHDNRIVPTKRNVKSFLSKYDENFFADYIKVRYADTYAQSEYKREEKLKLIDDVKSLGEEIIKNKECLHIKDLDITGCDLESIGLSGKEIGEALSACLNGVLDEALENKKSDLIKYIKEHKH